MDNAGRFLRTVGIAQGAYFLWFTLGGGALVTAIGTGVLAVYSQLPWWSLLLAGIGLFLIGAGTSNFLARIVSSHVAPRSEPFHALTRVIEDGKRLRKRLAELTEDPDDDEQSRWDWRVEEWNKDADQTVERVAPFRLAVFRADILVVEYPGVKYGRPEHVARWEYDVEVILERLLYIRVTLY